MSRGVLDSDESGWDSSNWGWSNSSWGSIGEWGSESWGIAAEGIAAVSIGKWEGPLGAQLGLFELGEEISLGSGNLGGVGWSRKSVDGLGKVGNWSNWELGGLDTESKAISNVVGGLGEAVGINVAVGSSDTSIGVSSLLLGRVDVVVAISVVGELILLLELGRSDGWGSSSVGEGWSGSKGWASSIGHWGSSKGWGSSIGDWGSIAQASIAQAQVVWGKSSLEWSHKGGLGDRGKSHDGSNKGLHIGIVS